MDVELFAALEPVVAAADLELVDVEYLREPGGWILRLFIDRAGRDPLAKEGGSCGPCAAAFARPRSGASRASIQPTGHTT